MEADEYFKDKRLQVSIFMSPLNVHVNRNPVTGEVLYSEYHPGKFLVAWHPKSSSDNERHSVVYRQHGKESINTSRTTIAIEMIHARTGWFVIKKFTESKIATSVTTVLIIMVCNPSLCIFIAQVKKAKVIFYTFAT